MANLPSFNTKILEFSLMQSSWATILNPIIKKVLGSSSGATSGGQSTVTQEYVWNFGNVTAAGAIDTSSFGVGPQGTPMLAYNSGTANNFTYFQCRFQNPIQDSDLIFLEVQRGSTSPSWQGAANSEFSFFQNNLNIYGMAFSFYPGITTDIIVYFGNAGASFYAGGTAWPGPVTPARWRVRKISFS